MFKTFVRRRRIEFRSLGFVWDLSFVICDLKKFYSDKGRTIKSIKVLYPSSEMLHQNRLIFFHLRR
jgi:hypothetical protein